MNEWSVTDHQTWVYSLLSLTFSIATYY